MKPHLVSIWIKPQHKRPMKAVQSALLVANRGLLGSANQNGRRQVTVISQERWHAVQQELGVEVDPSLRRANLMVTGIDLRNTRGCLLRVGPAVIDVWGETRPCELMDEGHPGLQAALRADWGGGIFGVIVEGGEVRIGDPVELLAGPQRELSELLHGPAGQA
ncbi:MAG TPA: MOSC domain-containing protein [Longimicrobiales bacterium]|nr:MOSC domain-containing protein [Longimicrobiales bacterium]